MSRFPHSSPFRDGVRSWQQRSGDTSELRIVAVHPVMDGLGQRRIIAGHRTTPAPTNHQTPRNGPAPGRSSDIVALRPLAFYNAVGKRLADGAAA